MTARVVVVGSSNTDLVVRAPSLPSPGETVVGGDFLRAAGGKGANQAVAAARLGARVGFVGRLGDDDFGRAARAGLAAEGLDVRDLGTDPERPSGVALIVVDDRAENQIAVAPGANAALTAAHVDAAEDAIRQADVLLLQLEVPLPAVARAAALARRHGVPVVLNPAPAAPLDDKLLAHVDVLTPNQHEARQLAGLPADASDPEQAAARLRARGLPAVVITLGVEGCLIVDASGARRIDGMAVEAVDTTGAGDAFNGALATALAEGRTLDDAARWATAAAALAVTRIGAQPALATRVEVETLLTT